MTVKLRKIRGKNPVLRFFFRIITGCKHRRLQNISVSSFCKTMGIQIVIEAKEQNRTVFVPEIVFSTRPQEQVEFLTPSIFSTVLPDSIITGENNHLVIGNYCLNERFDFPQANEIDFCHGSKCLYHDNQNSLVEIDAHCKEIKEGIPLYGEASLNYYHWLFDICGSIVYVNRHPELKRVPLLVDQATYERPTFMELLKCVDYYEHPIMVLKRNKTYLVRKLFYFSPCSFGSVYSKTSSNHKTESISINYTKNKDVINLYRSIINKNTEGSAYGTKLFITRGDRKRLSNEDEAFSIAKKFGFERIRPERLSLSQQISAFSNADYVIAEYGAGCTNVLWGKEKSLFLVLTPKSRIDYFFSTIAYECKVQYSVFLTEGYDQALQHHVELDKFDDYLSSLFK